MVDEKNIIKQTRKLSAFVSLRLYSFYFLTAKMQGRREIFQTIYKLDYNEE